MLGTGKKKTQPSRVRRALRTLSSIGDLNALASDISALKFACFDVSVKGKLTLEYRDPTNDK